MLYHCNACTMTLYPSPNHMRDNCVNVNDIRDADKEMSWKAMQWLWIICPLLSPGHLNGVVCLRYIISCAMFMILCSGTKLYKTHYARCFSFQKWSLSAIQSLRNTLLRHIGLGWLNVFILFSPRPCPAFHSCCLTFVHPFKTVTVVL